MTAPLTSDGLANDCRHDSASGVDTTPLADPGKVWACDQCGYRWRQDGAGERVAAPLTTRDAIVRALAEHDWHAADDFDWSRPCRHADHKFSAFCAVCSGDLGLMADALLASGALTDATKLAEDDR